MLQSSIATLLVEDDRYQLEALADNLRLEGFEVHEASSASEALEVMELEGEELSLGILDIDLPGKTDGIALLEAVKTRWPSFDAIMLSGKATAANAAAALNLGASSFLFKPCDPEHVIRTLHALHEKQSLQAQNGAMLRELAQLKNRFALDGLDISPLPGNNGTPSQSLVHEVSNQLTILLGNFDLILDEEKVPGDETLRCQLSRMRDVTLRMQSILSNHRSSRGSFSPCTTESCDLRQLAEELLEQCAHLLRPQGIRYRAPLDDSPVHIRCDRAQIEQLLTNLLLNAIEAMPNGGCLNVDLERSESSRQGKDHGLASLTVRDTGPGIAETVLPRIFDRFVTDKAKGNGLGLYLARQIARNHGGNLVGSNTAVGAKFVLTLPLASEKTKD